MLWIRSFGQKKQSAKVFLFSPYVKYIFVLLLDRFILWRLKGREGSEEEGAHVGGVSFQCQLLCLVFSTLPQFRAFDPHNNLPRQILLDHLLINKLKPEGIY
jgi:hypothetical protein